MLLYTNIFKQGELVSFEYDGETIQRKITYIGGDGTLHIQIDDRGDIVWSVSPENARPVVVVNPVPDSDDAAESEDPPKEKKKPIYLSLDTYAKVATVCIFGGLIISAS